MSSKLFESIYKRAKPLKESNSKRIVAEQISKIAQQARKDLLAGKWGKFDADDPWAMVGEEGPFESLWSGEDDWEPASKIYDLADNAGVDNSPEDFLNAVVNTIFGLEYDNNNFIYPLDNLGADAIYEAMIDHSYDDDTELYDDDFDGDEYFGG